MSESGRGEMILFALAHRLRVDVDEVRLWPYRKINEWLAYFDARERLSEQKR